MHSKIKLGKISGIEIGLHYSWFIIAALIVFSLTPDTQVLDALKLMAGNNVNQLPVVANGTWQGILSRSHLMQLLHARAELRLPAAHYPRLQHR